MRNIFSCFLLAMLPAALCSQAIPVDCHDMPLMIYGNSTGFSTLFNVSTDSIPGSIFLSPFPNNSGAGTNGIGYRAQDRMVYGCLSSQLVRIDGTGAVEILTSLPVNSYSADVTPDGKYYVMTFLDSLYLIDLESGLFEITRRKLTYTNQTSPFDAVDIAFDPVSGVLYSFNNSARKLVTIDLSTGLVDNSRYSSVNIPGEVPVLFFDRYGYLWGFSYDVFYQFSTATGQVIADIPHTLPIKLGIDGCSCPKSFYFLKSATPDTVSHCAGVDFTFTVINNTGQIQQDIAIEDWMPPGMTIDQMIRNPFGGQVSSGVGTNYLHLTGLTVPAGVDSVIVRVKMDDLPSGTYKNQALIKNIQLYGAPSVDIVSDDPATRILSDSTTLEVTDLQAIHPHEYLFLCDDEGITIDASQPLVDQYLWNTGAQGAQIKVDQTGDYIVSLASGCETSSDTFSVSDGGIIVDLGDDLEIYAGDKIPINPEISGPGTINSILWTWNPVPEYIDCSGCLEQVLSPVVDGNYSLAVINEYGCPAFDELFIKVKRPIYIANVFAPDGDENNSIFFVQTRNNLMITFLRIFDRWGELVFERRDFPSNDVSVGWNGTYKNRKSPAGVYIWHTEIRDTDGQTRVMHGDVTLIR